jgi:hypothetical protein
LGNVVAPGGGAGDVVWLYRSRRAKGGLSRRISALTLVRDALKQVALLGWTNNQYGTRVQPLD